VIQLFVDGVLVPLGQGMRGASVRGPRKSWPTNYDPLNRKGTLMQRNITLDGPPHATGERVTPTLANWPSG
jgi:hypothetical protein